MGHQLALVCVPLLLSANVAQAASVIDQQNIVPPASSNQLFSTDFAPFRLVQTLTVGLSGTITSVDVQYYGNANTVSAFNFLETNSLGRPTTTVLGTGALTASTTPSFPAQGWLTFTTDLAVVAGQVLAIEPVISSYGFGWAFGSNTYAGGTSFYSQSNVGQPASFIPQLTDLGFRTYVDAASAVPEPATWAMMIGGFGMVGGMMRRRTRITTNVKFA